MVAIFSGKRLFVLLALATFLYSLFIALHYASQTPLDLYSFRQTQTALTAYWLIKNGFSFAYETPVGGAPWSIPFEFPIYQYIVALISKSTAFSLDAVGRIISFIFLALCLIPTRAMINQLRLPIVVFYIFAALLFSSPVYLYWGRAFMIETAAVFFAVTAIKYFIDIVQTKPSLLNQLLFLLFISLSILQKATTGSPVLAVLCLVYGYLLVREADSIKNFLFSKKMAMGVIYFGLPLAIGIVWTLYTDHIKALNEFGVQITSHALAGFNLGSLPQRLSFYFYSDVIWRRIFERNLGGVFGVAILLIALFSNTKTQVKWIIIIALLMGFLPLFLFTNLHIVHDYYQSANIIFLLFALSVSLGSIFNHSISEKNVLFPLTLLVVVSNYCYFSSNYLSIIKTVYNKENSREYAVAEAIKKAVPPGKYFVAFGNDWSSSLPYLSQRKSFSVPPFFAHYDSISRNPEHFIAEANLGAVVLCPPVTSLTVSDLAHWASTGRHWTITEVHGCYLAIKTRHSHA